MRSGFSGDKDQLVFLLQDLDQEQNNSQSSFCDSSRDTLDREVIHPEVEASIIEAVLGARLFEIVLKHGEFIREKGPEVRGNDQPIESDAGSF